MAILVDHATLQSVHVLALAEAMRKVNDEVEAAIKLKTERTPEACEASLLAQESSRHALRVVKRIGDLLEAYERQEARV